MRKQKKSGYFDRLKLKWKRWATRLENAAFPDGIRCIACNSELKAGEGNFCESCREQLPFRTGEYCTVCGEALDRGICLLCKTEKFYFDFSYAPFHYAGLIRHLILRYKNGEGWLSRYFGEMLSDYLKLMGCEYDLITFVPADKKSRIKKGFDHAKEIAKNLAKSLDTESIVTLERVTPSGQKTYDRLGRKAAIAGAFLIKEKNLTDKRIILVDDVMTTGSTANECARVLKEHGAKSVTVFTVAR